MQVNPLKLDSRLFAVLENIPLSKCIADIGCDHGKLICSALMLGKTKKGIAIDISHKSLEKARLLSEELNVSLDCRFGDGLAPLCENEVDVVIICGMGGLEIIKILSQSKNVFNNYIFVPHTDAVKLRKFLVENGYKIIKDFKTKANDKFYDCIIADFDGKKYNMLINEMFFGKDTKSDVFKEYATKRLCFLESVLIYNKECSEEYILLKEEYESL